VTHCADDYPMISQEQVEQQNQCTERSMLVALFVLHGYLSSNKVGSVNLGVEGRKATVA
jgi:hypothetical protein